MAENRNDQPAVAGSAGNGGAIDRKLGRWFIILSQFVFLLVIVGGAVRLSGSGLSIPEWPLINGSLLPPLSEQSWEAVYKTYHREIIGVEVQGLEANPETGAIPAGQFKVMFWTEYCHRFVAALFGLLFLWVFIKVLRDTEARKKYGLLMVFALCLLLTQAILGGMVVKYDLPAALVTVHLGVAFIFFAILFWTGLAILYPGSLQSNPKNRTFTRTGLVAGVVVFTQVLTGGMVAGTQAGFHLNTWPLIGDYLIPPLNLLWSAAYKPGLANLLYNKLLLQFIHRWWAFAAAGLVIYLVVLSLRIRVGERARLGLRSLAALIVLQLILGVLTLLLQVPAILAVTHLATAMLLFELLILVTHEFRYHEIQPV
ncbi:MAG: hypothetical protein A3F83_09170 [Candidatus Glassbacteria bacterium RIFCSPLOWO2_12_FULL_58_11]|uniref:Cytochrome oxidase assembly protein n=1 Tax=Candidatus Glassbacteria bacterium RIFCSPLOWO2_12_FULL_58_11 TaxID=1817867 RepID=A0A1F5YTV6_9BACT|nr:MAG: hypothetical protein A3F83_09170 [Candidatus Glassbacteria bacterium RIFCSPLOWO2_12_FULL_58_11]